MLYWKQYLKFRINHINYKKGYYERKKRTKITKEKRTYP